MKKIAIPVDNGTLSSHFGHCSHFALINIEEGKISAQELLQAPPHQPGLLPPWLAERGVTDVIAGGIGQKAIQIFNNNNINVFAGAPQLSTEELVNGFINNNLTFSANYCDH